MTTDTLKAFSLELDQLKSELDSTAGVEDLNHLKKMMMWQKACWVFGIGTAWIFPNPISILLLSQAKFVRWTMIAHHVLHHGYEAVPGVPQVYLAKNFAQGWRRWIDWNDWMVPKAWMFEHNIQHHYSLGEVNDPDRVDLNTTWLRKSDLPSFLKLLVVFASASTWKFSYYAANTYREWLSHRTKQPNSGMRVWLNVIGRCYVPYISWNFILLPLLFLPLGWKASLFVLINVLLAEWLTNLHSFLVIVSNHAGEDVQVFDTKTTSRAEFYYRQIVGSVNFRTGSDWNDFMHGWLNYQIEHHLFPRMTMLQYRRAQPRVQALCLKYGVPYIQESVWKRLGALLAVMTGRKSMRAGDIDDGYGNPNSLQNSVKGSTRIESFS